MLFESYPKDIHCSSVVFRYPYRAKVLLQSTKIYNDITKHFLNTISNTIMANIKQIQLLQLSCECLSDADDAALVRLENFGMSHIL